MKTNQLEKAGVDYFPERTSLNQVAAGLKRIHKVNKSGGTNLDYGGGEYNKGTNYLKKKGIFNLIFDKYARDNNHNKDVLDHIEAIGGADSVTLLNVLNVIADKAERAEILRDAFGRLKYNGKMLIEVYEGNRSGIGKLTTWPTWQENRGTADYIDEIKEALGNVSVKLEGKSIIVTKTRDSWWQKPTESDK